MSYQIIIFFSVRFPGCLMVIWEYILPHRKYLGKDLSVKYLGIKCHDICPFYNESEEKVLGESKCNILIIGDLGKGCTGVHCIILLTFLELEFFSK